LQLIECIESLKCEVKKKMRGEDDCIGSTKVTAGLVKQNFFAAAEDWLSRITLRMTTGLKVFTFSSFKPHAPAGVRRRFLLDMRSCMRLQAASAGP
jgi:hypothetical protein